MIRRLALLAGILLCATSVRAQNVRVWGFCTPGSENVVLQGLTQSSPPGVMGSHAGCTVTVYNTGTLTLTTIFAAAGGGAMANPFTANSTTGYWFYYVPSSTRMDVVISGAGLSSSFTYGDVEAAGGGGGSGNCPIGATNSYQINAGGGACAAGILTQDAGATTVTDSGSLLVQGTLLNVSGSINSYLDTGSANTYVVTTNPTLSSIPVNYQVCFLAANASTGASTLNIDALGAIAITKGNSFSAIAAGDIWAGGWMCVRYDGTEFQTNSPLGNINPGLTNPMTTAGDLIVGGAAGVPARLAVNPTSVPEVISSSNGNTTAVSQGVNVDAQTSSYTLTCPLDRLGEVDYHLTSAATLTVPQAGSTACLQNNIAFAVRLDPTSTSVLTVTPTSSTFKPENAATHNILPSGGMFVWSDAFTTTGNYHALYVPPAYGGVIDLTASYSPNAGDNGKIDSITSGSACVFTLPATPPDITWTVGLLSLGASVCTVNLNGNTFNGSGTPPVLFTNQVLWVQNDGTHYEGSIPVNPVGGSGCTVGGTVNQIVVNNGSTGCNSSQTTLTTTGNMVFPSTATLTIPSSAGAAPAANGLLSQDSSCQDIDFGSGAATRYVPVFFSAIPSADTITTAGAFATTINVPGPCLFVKSLITIRAHGIYTTTATAAPAMNWEVNAGSTTGICPAASSSSLSLNITNGTFDVYCYIQIDTTGAGGTSIAYGKYEIWNSTGALGTTSAKAFVNSSTVTYNTSAANEPVSLQETAVMVSGQSMTLQYITVQVDPE